jgi:phosphoglucomutase
MRGILGAGTNRLNVYTVRKAAAGLANYVMKQGQKAKEKGIVIAYDSRKYSKEFADEITGLLVRKGIKVYLFQEICPTPLLSFAIRYIHAFAGIVITASHNPPEYNGIKVYNQDGGQITEEAARDIYTEIQKIADPLLIPAVDTEKNEGSNEPIAIGDDLFEAYMDQVEALLHNRPLIQAEGESLGIVYTPLHGTGNKVIRTILKRVGFSNVHIVEQQEKPDSRFPTVKAPNPEEREVFELALLLAEEKQADVVMATDPDADRLGVLVKTGDGYQLLNGNQLGALLLHYLLEQTKARGIQIRKGLLLKTIVTSDLGEKIAAMYGLQTFNTLTGFKYIGEKMQECRNTGSHTFFFGYEESYGYLAGDFVRDKDAVQITAIVAEMALFYKRHGKDLFCVLEEIYAQHGFYCEELLSITLAGKEGQKQIQECLSSLRQNLPKEVAGIPVQAVEDYFQQVKFARKTEQTEALHLPKANVVKIILEDESWITVRPSGTEPKMKVYFSAVSQHSKKEAEEKLAAFQTAWAELIQIS